MQHNNGSLILENGKMVNIVNDSDIPATDLDARLNNFIFEPLDVWKELTETPDFYRPIGAYEVDNNFNLIDFTIPEEEMQKLFGYLLNNKANVKLDNVSADNTDDKYAKFISGIIYPKK